MNKDEIIAKILEFQPSTFTLSNIYKVITKGEWDIEKLKKEYNITLHVIWRSLKHQKN